MIDPAAAVKMANDRLAAPGLAARDQFYTLASARIGAAGCVSATVAFAACPADARARMVAAARKFYLAIENEKFAFRAREALVDALLAWNLRPEAEKLVASINKTYTFKMPE